MTTVATPPRAATSQRRRPLTPVRGAAVWALATVSVLAVWLIVFCFVLSPFQANRMQTVLYSQLREQLALQTAPLGDSTVPGAPVAIISAPELGVNDVVVVEGTASGDLMNGPGHRRDTVLPAQTGVSVILGRGTLYGGPFGALRDARKGDLVTVTTAQGVFQFTVRGTRSAGSPLPPPLDPGSSRLVLVSTWENGFSGMLARPRLVYVDADLSGDAQPSPVGRPRGIPQSEWAMQGDHSSYLPLAIGLPLLLASVVFAVWARSRWGGWQAWLVGIPLIFATLWAVSTATVQLLPNLL